ncbi:hypothetical protein TWF225_000414 [Orbilia oligospora]|uniref:Ferric oxidoreductase domain-containing protein n=1 Tax=Orbilia oligospora TaxID=2813651 RepID=A0A8H2HUR2_ORBOL|nr:hypothetical protein TWF225_000414 [Orbilia oligospora]KAF3254151.1 hypothetical protein TWF128_006277 [Orbilia oligospora]KAF3272022.1 hypothetical protein TWF217_003840 [Orbilia oligospora]KAF3297812.1 hypothetical protein TWF132_006207 [Orbilia oligospora]TGJ69692.1 hypothetical protein EYR41_005714 [Orbilia oligospora]
MSNRTSLTQLRSLLVIAVLIVGAVAAGKDFTGRVAHGGTVGLGVKQWDPVCAYACRNSAAGFMLDCGESHHGMDHGSMMMHHMPSPQCYATNDFFMQTLAWCIHTHCPQDTPISKLETYWEMNVAGRKDNQPLPKYSYQDALARVIDPPTGIVNSTEILNRTSLVNEWFYSANYGALSAIEKNISVDNVYTLVVVLTCTLGPILLSLVRFLPIPQPLATQIYSNFIDPPAFGSNHAVPMFFGMGITPTRGQALFILYIWGINIILSGVSYTIVSPNLWYEGPQAVAMSIANRVGMLSFGNLILSILYSSRNNLLLYVTNWSRSTFVLLHRWLGFLTIIQACLHSVLYLQFQVKLGTHAEEAAYPYWYWGIIGTLGFTLILPFSVLPIRQKMYEFFLASHIVLFLIAIIGTFLHVYFRYYWQWGYEIWVAVAFAFWGFDRFLMRPIKVVQNGLIRRAHISVIDEDYLKIEIPGVDVQGQAYLYFPTLTWRIWENHPFSVLPLAPASRSTTPSEDLEAGKEGGSEAKTRIAHVGDEEKRGPGIVFFIRRMGGLTSKLAAHASDPNGVMTLVEGSYGPESSILNSPIPRPSTQYPNVLFFAGGVGITGVLPLLDRPFLASAPGTTKLFWGVRTEPLVRAVEDLFGDQGVGNFVDNKARWGNADVKVSISERINIKEVLEVELLGQNGNGGTTVMVCGPSSMRDDVRVMVAQLGKRGAIVRFTEDQYGW